MRDCACRILAVPSTHFNNQLPVSLHRCSLFFPHPTPWATLRAPRRRTLDCRREYTNKLLYMYT